MSELICQYCNKPSKYVDSKVIYGKSYGMVYWCQPCDAYVGVHKGTNKPLGILANKELRDWKKKAHAKFDTFWKSGKFKRSYCYERLSKALKIKPEDCHIGMFDVKMCKKVVSLCSQ